MNRNHVSVKKLCFASMFLAIGWLMPFISMQIPEIGNMLCLMHIPVIIAGFMLGARYGLILGFITPITRSFVFGRPPFYPNAVCMAFELATYGFLAGILLNVLQKKFKCGMVTASYVSLILAMLGGRIVWGIAQVICGLFGQSAFTWKAFMAGAFITAWPGIIIQLLLIPPVIILIKQTGRFED